MRGMAKAVSNFLTTACGTAPAARQTQVTDTATSHLGFRCVLRTGDDGIRTSEL